MFSFKNKNSPPSPPSKSFAFSRKKSTPPPPEEIIERVDRDVESVLEYGYSGLNTDSILSCAEVLSIAKLCAGEIKSSGLEVPLVLSTMSLDVDSDASANLIRIWSLSNNSDPILNYSNLSRELAFCSSAVISSFLKWALARLVGDGGQRGFISWKYYNDWKDGEKQSNYPADYCNILLRGLPRNESQLLETLLDLFSSVAAHSGKNGMPPRKLAALFGPLLLGLSSDKNFDETYSEWVHFTDGLEHIIISYLRLQKIREGRLPTNLLPFIATYPQPSAVTSSAEVLRFRKLVRWHSSNLISSARTWSVPNSKEWSLFFPSPTASPSSDSSSDTSLPIYTTQYRHLLNIRSGFETEGDGKSYRSKSEAEWGSFGRSGFIATNENSLQFDLTESRRLKLKQRPLTLDWGSFSDSGFEGRETYLPQDLDFLEIESSPRAQKELELSLLETEKALPPFNFDTTAQEAKTIFIDPNFFEAWAVLVSSGWVKEESKESNFSLIQYKAQPRNLESSRSGGEIRTVDRWVLVEEIIPASYRADLANFSTVKKKDRTSFLRSVRSKSGKSLIPVTRLNVSQIPASPPSLPASLYGNSNNTAIAQSRDYQTVYDPRADDGSTTRLRLESKLSSPTRNRVNISIREEDEENVPLRSESSKGSSFLARAISKVTPRNSNNYPPRSEGISSTSVISLVRSSSLNDSSPELVTPPPPPPKSLPPASVNDRMTMISTLSSPAISSSNFTDDESGSIYDGIEEEAALEQVGKVLFRGSRSYPRQLIDQAQIIPSHLVRSTATTATYIDAPAIVVLSPPASLIGSSIRGSLDVPKDNETFSEEGHSDMNGSEVALKNIRLTQYGFETETMSRITH